jgi:hypothetical protein
MMRFLLGFLAASVSLLRLRRERGQFAQPANSEELPV